MNRGNRRLVAGLLAGVLAGVIGWCTVALAQQTDTYLQRYDLAIENLNQAVAAVPSDGAKARSELDHAVNALMTLSRNTTSGTLVKAMENLFGRARTAIQNDSKTDLAVQTAVLAGGFRRLVYDAALKAAVDGDLATGKVRIEHIASDMQFDPASMDAVRAAGSPTVLRLSTEEGAARTISEEVSVARRLLPTDRAVAYRTLADAYGTSLLVQDSPRLQSSFNQHFVDAAHALVAKDDTSFQKATEAISAAAGRLAQADRLALTAATAAPAKATTTSGQAAPAALPSVSAAGTGPSSPASAPNGSTAASGGAPTGSSTATSAASAPAAATPTTLAAARSQVLAEQRQQRLDALTREIHAAGLAGSAGQKLAETFLRDNVDNVQGATRGLLASVAQATADAMAGDLTAARSSVTTASKRYQQLLAPLVAVKAPDVDRQTRDAFRNTADRVGLRLQDLNNLASQVDAVSRALSGAPPPPNLAVNRALASWWAGWPRLLVLLVFGILVFIPLYLLNLAFGGGNRNWQLIGIALFLLLLPVVYEALASLGSMLTSWTHNDAFDVLAAYSMFQSTLGQVVWAALIVLAILFAILGLYGICVQFGLLGRGRGRRGGTATQTATTTSTSTQERADSMVDWDEEF